MNAHETAMFALRFSSRNDIAVSTNPYDICWLGPGFSSVTASTEDVLSAKSMIVDRSPSVHFRCFLLELSVVLASPSRIAAGIDGSYTYQLSSVAATHPSRISRSGPSFSSHKRTPLMWIKRGMARALACEIQTQFRKYASSRTFHKVSSEHDRAFY